jgi:DNA-binding response OmpR family regulator
MANILIIDDRPHLREFLAEELIDEGFRISGVSDSEPAIRDLPPK